MTFPAKLSLGVLLVSLGAVVIIVLGTAMLPTGTMGGEGVMLQLLLSGLIVALVSSGAALLFALLLTKGTPSTPVRATSGSSGRRDPGTDGRESSGVGAPGAEGTARTKKALLRRAEEELRDVREQLRGVSMYLESAREGERKRIARDIHDDLGQSLSALKLDLSLLRDELPDLPGKARKRIEGMTHLVVSSIKSVKRIISELRPQVLDDLGLTAAIEWQAEEFQKRTGIPIELSVYPQEIILEADQSTAVFRIFQETLANVARHAGAQSVRASLTEIDGVVELAVQDDGCGIRQEQINDPRSFGLLGIRERAHSWGGRVEIEGTPESGTRVLVRFEDQEEQ